MGLRNTEENSIWRSNHSNTYVNLWITKCIKFGEHGLRKVATTNVSGHQVGYSDNITPKYVFVVIYRAGFNRSKMIQWRELLPAIA